MRLIQGDCLDVLPTLDDSSVDLILTDPPYYKVKGEAWDRQWDTVAGFLAWLDLVFEQYYRVLKPNGSLYVFASPQMSDRVSVLMRERFNVLNNIRWVKEAGWHNKTEKEALRSFLSPYESIIFAEHYGADGYAKGEAGYTAKVDELRGFVFEPIVEYMRSERDRAGVTDKQIDEYCGWKTQAFHYFARSGSNFNPPTEKAYYQMREAFTRLNHGGEYLKREYEDLKREYEDLRRPFNVTADVPYTDVWTFKTVKPHKGKHPCEKPLDMLEHIINASSKAGGVVLDTFMGTGNTGKAAQALGRDFIGIEKDAKYFSIAEKRINEVQLEMV